MQENVLITNMKVNIREREREINEREVLLPAMYVSEGNLYGRDNV